METSTQSIAVAICVYTLLIAWVVRRPHKDSVGQNPPAARIEVECHPEAGRESAEAEHARRAGARAEGEGPLCNVRPQATIDRVFIEKQ